MTIFDWFFVNYFFHPFSKADWLSIDLISLLVEDSVICMEEAVVLVVLSIDLLHFSLSVLFH